MNKAINFKICNDYNLLESCIDSELTPSEEKKFENGKSLGSKTIQVHQKFLKEGNI